jgi:hypothetical protein
MTPFQVFRRLVTRVGLFGRVDYDVVASIGLYKPVEELTSKRIANLALTYLNVQERDVLMQALAVKQIEKSFDPERNKEILGKAGVDVSPVSVEPVQRPNYIKPSEEAVGEIFDELLDIIPHSTK